MPTWSKRRTCDMRYVLLVSWAAPVEALYW
jgi:hypothetical protein